MRFVHRAISVRRDVTEKKGEVDGQVCWNRVAIGVVQPPQVSGEGCLCSHIGSIYLSIYPGAFLDTLGVSTGAQGTITIIIKNIYLFRYIFICNKNTFFFSVNNIKSTVTKAGTSLWGGEGV